MITMYFTFLNESIIPIYNAFSKSLTYLTYGLSAIDSLKPSTTENGAISNTDTVSCPPDIPWTCTNKTIVNESCCFEYPGGIILLTQFWDYNPGTGPKNEFTLHGLWSDRCDGSYDEFCDRGLEIHDPEKIVKRFNEPLYKEMKRIWKDYKGGDENLWAHEYNKHGTCFTTLKPSCYENDHQNQVYVYDFFKTAVELHSSLPTFEFLAKEGIVPSKTASYTQKQILSALRNNFKGYEPYVKCDNNGAIKEIWYFHHLKGSLTSGKFQEIDTFNPMRCPTRGIRFPPKKYPTLDKPLPIPNPEKPGNGSGNPSRGFIKLTGLPGCLIRNGKWYASGSCATYTLIPTDDGFSLKSSGGYCNVDEINTLRCGPNVGIGNFSFNEGSKCLGFDGQNTWTADVFPKHRIQAPVSLGLGGAFEFQLKFY